MIIGRGALSRAGAEAARFLPAGRAAIMTDDTVNALWGGALADALTRAGWQVDIFAFPHGESSKTLATYALSLNFLAERRFTRTDTVFALGGGVAGDLAGFTAATYLRGVNLVQVPTTLLACVDSSIGGKTAVDLPSGKNLAGAFYPPRMVLIDPDTLSTLPDHTLREGAAEVVKYAALRDEALLPLLNDLRGNAEEIIRRCVAIKCEIVQKDPRDTGERQLLNFGHTFGHAIEKLSGYTLSHGEAIAAGMGVMARACARMGLCERAEAQKILDALTALKLPTDTSLPADALLEAASADKKRAGEAITLVLLRAVGHCELRRVPFAQAREFAQKGVSAWT